MEGSEGLNHKDETPNKSELFNIVLVDIQKTVAQKQVCCEEMEFQGNAVEYITLSYRWGELDEQFVPATDDYYAHITSFHLDDFYELCKRMMSEPDLKDIKYVWVDAICVDQGNDQRKKATIYRMNDIYKSAAYIVAVPDLHKASLINFSSLNERMGYLIVNYSWYLYHLICEDFQELRLLDDDWRNEVLSSRYPIRELEATMEPFNTLLLYTKTTYAERHGLPSLPEQDPKNKDEQDWTARYQMITEKMLQLDRENRIFNAMQYLQGLFLDWANRAWVISEYSIAKEKNDGKMKYWFIHLDYKDNFYGKPFFTLDFNRERDYTDRDSHWSAALSSIYYNNDILHTVKRSFLDKILRSRVTKNEDRFHAILPLSPKYSKIIRSKDTISSWNITDMISVRLKLYEILDTEDKLVLLLSSPKQSHARLPTFVSDTSPFMIPEFGTCPFFAEELNFDLNDRSAVHLESNRLNSNSGDYQGPSLLLRPKKYYIHEPIDLLLQDMDEVNEYSRAIKKLGFESVDESVRFVTISLHCTDDDSDIILRRVNRDGDILEYERNATLIRLLGNMDKNIWILCYFNGNDKRLSRSSHYHKDYAFRVY